MKIKLRKNDKESVIINEWMNISNLASKLSWWTRKLVTVIDPKNSATPLLHIFHQRPAFFGRRLGMSRGKGWCGMIWAGGLKGSGIARLWEGGIGQKFAICLQWRKKTRETPHRGCSYSIVINTGGTDFKSVWKCEQKEENVWLGIKTG